jgi:hypothetical protein
MICVRVYGLEKACVDVGRNLDRFWAGQEMQRSAHPILWIYIDFSTAGPAEISQKRL